MSRSRQQAVLADLGVLAATAGWFAVLWQQQQADELSWPTGTQLVIEGTMLVVALAILPARRRHPTLTAAVLLPLAASAFTVVPAVVVLYRVACERPRQLAVGLGAGYVAAAIVGSTLVDHPEPWPARVLLFVATFALPVALGIARQARRDLLHEYEQRALHAEAEQLRQVEQARVLERQRIAREMHDVVAHRISLVSLYAGGLASWQDAPQHEVRRAAEVIRASAHEALQELRGVITVLRDMSHTAEPERPQPGLEDLPLLFERCRAAGTSLHVSAHTDDLPDVPLAVGRTAYRIVEEGLTNAAKHAPRAPVEATIDARRPGRLVLEVSNPLPLSVRGARPATATTASGTAGLVDARANVPGSGAGLIGLAERVGIVDGELEHGPTDDGRFRLRAELPWRS